MRPTAKRNGFLTPIYSRLGNCPSRTIGNSYLKHILIENCNKEAKKKKIKIIHIFP
jgi:hypothetical protein